MAFNAVMTPSDLAKGALAPVGWHPAEFTKYEEKAAKTDGSTNIIMTFTIIDGPAKGMSANQFFNEKALAFGKALWKLWGFPQDSEGNIRVSDEMIKAKLNSKLKIYITHTEKDGKKYNNIEDYTPLS